MHDQTNEHEIEVIQNFVVTIVTQIQGRLLIKWNKESSTI
jgi:hypothetical protein